MRCSRHVLPRGDPGAYMLGRLYPSAAWKHLSFTPKEIGEVDRERAVWASLVKLQPPNLDTDKQKKMDRVMSNI